MSANIRTGLLAFLSIMFLAAPSLHRQKDFTKPINKPRVDAVLKQWLGA